MKPSVKRSKYHSIIEKIIEKFFVTSFSSLIATQALYKKESKLRQKLNKKWRKNLSWALRKAFI